MVEVVQEAEVIMSGISESFLKASRIAQTRHVHQIIHYMLSTSQRLMIQHTVLTLSVDFDLLH